MVCRMRQDLRESFYSSRAVREVNDDTSLLEMMSPTLQAELVLAVNQRWVRSVWFLAGVETEFVVRLTLAL